MQGDRTRVLPSPVSWIELWLEFFEGIALTKADFDQIGVN